MLSQQIQQLSESFFKDVVAFRRHLHQYPELSFKEVKTTQFIEQQLNNLGIETTREYGDTGVVGFIYGNNPEKQCIALRADIDALPIQEQNDLPFQSKHEGIMHACGHDVHSASLFGAAKILQELKSEFEGTIKLIFQPAEELLPGGASIYIKNGVLNEPKVESIFGQHVFPDLPAGKVGFRPGLYMASADELHVTIKGIGGHAALAEIVNDPIIAMSHLLIAVREGIENIKIDDVPYVIGFGKIIANGATNIIPDGVKILGTFRTMQEEWRERAHQEMEKIAQEIAKQFDVEIDFDIKKGYPFLNNDVDLTKKAKQLSIDYLGAENVIDLPIRMSSEDFASYTHFAKGCFYRLGTSNSETDLSTNVHTSTFMVNEEALKIGMGLMAFLAINQLNT